MIRNLIIGVISFIVTLFFLIFLRWYAGFDLLERNVDNAIYIAFTTVMSPFSSFFLMIYLSYRDDLDE